MPFPHPAKYIKLLSVKICGGAVIITIRVHPDEFFPIIYFFYVYIQQITPFFSLGYYCIKVGKNGLRGIYFPVFAYNLYGYSEVLREFILNALPYTDIKKF